MLLNNRLLTNQKIGLRNSLKPTNQDFYVPLVDGKKKKKKKKNQQNNSVLAGRPSSKGARSSYTHFDPFPPLLSPATEAQFFTYVLIEKLYTVCNVLRSTKRIITSYLLIIRAVGKKLPRRNRCSE